MPRTFVDWRSVYFVDGASFTFYEYGVCHDVGCAIGADAVHSGGVALHDYENTAFYKLSLAIFSVFLTRLRSS